MKDSLHTTGTQLQDALDTTQQTPSAAPTSQHAQPSAPFHRQMSVREALLQSAPLLVTLPLPRAGDDPPTTSLPPYGDSERYPFDELWHSFIAILTAYPDVARQFVFDHKATLPEVRWCPDVVLRAGYGALLIEVGDDSRPYHSEEDVRARLEQWAYDPAPVDEDQAQAALEALEELEGWSVGGIARVPTKDALAHLKALAAEIAEVAPMMPSATTANSANAVVAPSRFELFTFGAMANLPRPQWLLRGLLVEKTSSILSADSGSFKSFLALDMALCMATGRPFMGRETKQGAVVYVAAEGFYTLYDRATAWSLHHGCGLPENFHILRVPVDVANAATRRRFVESVAALQPSLIVLDTLSQCSIGRNENSNDEMAGFMAGMMAACEELGAHVMALHHNGKHSGTIRGAGSIKANADTVITLERPEGDEANTVFVRCEKQRGAPFDAFALRGQVVELPYRDEFGDPLTSLVFEPCGEAVAPKTAKHPNTKRADVTREKLLILFDEIAAEQEGGVKIGTWMGKATKSEEGETPICKERTFWNYVKEFKGEGEDKTKKEIEEDGTHMGSKLYSRVNRSATTARTATYANCTECSADHNHDSATATTATTPKGVAVLAVQSDGGLCSDYSEPYVASLRGVAA